MTIDIFLQFEMTCDFLIVFKMSAHWNLSELCIFFVVLEVITLLFKCYSLSFNELCFELTHKKNSTTFEVWSIVVYKQPQTLRLLIIIAKKPQNMIDSSPKNSYLAQGQSCQFAPDEVIQKNIYIQF